MGAPVFSSSSCSSVFVCFVDSAPKLTIDLLLISILFVPPLELASSSRLAGISLSHASLISGTMVPQPVKQHEARRAKGVRIR